MTTLSLRSARQGHFLRHVLTVLSAGAGLRRQRAHLLALDAHRLRDIGITRADALTEARRPVWDAPAHWVQ